MSKVIWDWRVFAVSLLCGLLISLSIYPLAPWFFQSSTREFPNSIWWRLLRLVALLNLPPRIFIARFGEAAQMPEWLGGILAFLYWPFVGAVVGTRKHWLIWSCLVLAANIGLIALIFYLLSKMDLIFL